MKELFNLIIIIISTTSIHAQYLGINTNSPLAALHVRADSETSAILENESSLAISLPNSMYFAYGIQTPSTFKYAAAIKTIGMSPSRARLGLFTNASSTPAGLIERLTIDDDGRVGIANITPEWGLDVNAWSRFESNVGIMSAPNGSYALTVGGAARMMTDLRIDGILNPNNPLAIGNNTSIEGSLTVYNGKGIVRSTSSTQMKIKRVFAPFAATLSAGQTLTSTELDFEEDFTSVTVTVGHVNDGTGAIGKVLIVPFNVNEVQNTCQFQVTNVGNSTITFSGTWEIVLIGN